MTPSPINSGKCDVNRLEWAASKENYLKYLLTVHMIGIKLIYLPEGSPLERLYFSMFSTEAFKRLIYQFMTARWLDNQLGIKFNTSHTLNKLLFRVGQGWSTQY